MQAEETLWEGHPAQISNLGLYIFCAAAGILTAGIGFAVTLPVAVWQYFSTKKTIYRITNQRLITERGVLNTVADEVELYRVRDTTVKHPFLLRIFGLGHVELVTTDKSDKRILIKAIGDAKSVREMLRSSVEARRMATRTRDIEIS